MINDREYVTQSLELNLFFMRIMKEHSLFLEAAFVPKNSNLAFHADMLKNVFTNLLNRAINMSEGVISPQVITSGEIVTDLTYEAERETEYYSGIEINSNLTRKELYLLQQKPDTDAKHLVESVNELNEDTLRALRAIIDFKTKVLRDVLSCKLFTLNYPLLIDHLLREAKLFFKMLKSLQNRHIESGIQDMVEQEIFWSRIMAEHSKFIRGLLDPTEDKLINTANNFAVEFDKLTAEAEALSTQLKFSPVVTNRSLDAAKRISNFNRAGTEGLIECKIRSIILPLLGDHVLRESNHYIRLLKGFKAIE